MHYLPHHGVITASRRDAITTKLRVAFDASSKPSSDSPSLNECLYSGPALTPTIFNVLLRFREKRTALVGNIEKAFLNVAVAEEDRLGGQFRRRESRIDVIAVLSCGVWSQC